MKAYLTCIKKYFDFEGRSTRYEYWMFQLFNLIITVSLIIFDYSKFGYSLLSTMYILFIAIPSWSSAVRRVHDTGKSGVYVLVYFIPVVGSLIFLILMLGESDFDNEYGLSPYSENRRNGRQIKPTRVVGYEETRKKLERANISIEDQKKKIKLDKLNDMLILAKSINDTENIEIITKAINEIDETTKIDVDLVKNKLKKQMENMDLIEGGKNFNPLLVKCTSDIGDELSLDKVYEVQKTFKQYGTKFYTVVNDLGKKSDYQYYLFSEV